MGLFEEEELWDSLIICYRLLQKLPQAQQLVQARLQVRHLYNTICYLSTACVFPVCKICVHALCMHIRHMLTHLLGFLAHMWNMSFSHVLIFRHVATTSLLVIPGDVSMQSTGDTDLEVQPQKQFWSLQISNSQRASLCTYLAHHELECLVLGLILTNYYVCRSRRMMLLCCALWETSPWTTSTTRKRGTCPRGVAPEHRDHSHALHSGSNTGKRWAVSYVLLLITLMKTLFFTVLQPIPHQQAPECQQGIYHVMQSTLLCSWTLISSLSAYGKHMPANETIHCICCMWHYLHALHECRSFGGENAGDHAEHRGGTSAVACSLEEHHKL